MADWLMSGAIGFASGVLSGMFGIGGGIITTPAIRLLMGAPALVAVGTPLPVILPTAITGAFAYHRRKMSDVRAGVIVGLSGALLSVAGAWATTLVGGPVVLIATAVLIVVAAADTVLQAVKPPGADDGPDDRVTHPTLRLVALGVITGLYSGFFGLGGGFVLVPLLSRWMRFPLKRAIGTSLVGVALLAVPGTLTHALLGNIDWSIAAGLTIGVIPGALAGSHVTTGARDRTLRIAFAVLLVGAAAWLVGNEIAGLV